MSFGSSIYSLSTQTSVTVVGVWRYQRITTLLRYNLCSIYIVYVAYTVDKFQVIFKNYHAMVSTTSFYDCDKTITKEQFIVNHELSDQYPVYVM